MNDAKQATPAAELERQICSATEPKNDREWWAHHEIARLRAEVERLRADAERYRWLRENGSDSRVTEKDGYGGYRLMYFGDLDDAVDAARGDTSHGRALHWGNDDKG